MKILFFILLLATPSVAGEYIKEVRLTDGTVLKKVSVTKVTATGLYLTHELGSTRVLKEKLPADLQEQYAAEFAETEKRAAAREARRQAAGLDVNVYVKEGKGFYRYCFLGRDLTGKGCTGTLTVGFPVAGIRPVESKKTHFTAAMNGEGEASFDWDAGPLTPKRKAGVTRLFWSMKTDDGRFFKGVVQVPPKIAGSLPRDEKSAF